MALSRDAVTQGLYLQPFAEVRSFAIGLEPPPMMWIFEWDIVTGDSASLGVISKIVGDRVDETIALGEGGGRDGRADAGRGRGDGCLDLA